MKKNYFLNGWAITNSNIHIKNTKILPYNKYLNYNNFACKLKKMNCNALIGWSLGAQIAIKLVYKNIIRPRILILIAPPFQFISSDKYSFGTSEAEFKSFKYALKNTPKPLMLNFVKKTKNINLSHIDFVNPASWSVWLKELENFSCDEINFTNFPKTIIIHGSKDCVIDCEQSKLLQKKIRNSTLYVIKGSSHALHMRNKKIFNYIIKKYV